MCQQIFPLYSIEKEFIATQNFVNMGKTVFSDPEKSPKTQHPTLKTQHPTLKTQQLFHGA